MLFLLGLVSATILPKFCAAYLAPTLSAESTNCQNVSVRARAKTRVSGAEPGTHGGGNTELFGSKEKCCGSVVLIAVRVTQRYWPGHLARFMNSLVFIRVSL